LLEINFYQTQNLISSNDLSLERKGEPTYIMIEDELIKSLVFLQQQASFVKFGSSSFRSIRVNGTLISDLTKSPLVFHATGRSATAESPCFRASVVSIPHYVG